MIKNAAPRPILTGIKDETGRSLPVVREQIPQHLGLFYIMSKKGPTIPLLTSGADMLSTYGEETFDERSKYFSHQTYGLNTAAKYSSVFIKRLLPSDATRASMVFWLEIIEEDVEQYVRDEEGNVALDVDGAPIMDTGVTMAGYRYRWVIAPATDVNNLAAEKSKAGSLDNGTGSTSTMYPIMAFTMGHGEYGNNVGVRLSFPGEGIQGDPTDITVIKSQKNMVYRIQYMDRASANSSAEVTYTLNSEPYVDFTLKNGVINPKSNLELTPTRIKTEYEYLDFGNGYVPKFAPIEDYHIFDDDIENVLSLLYAKESQVTWPDPENIPVEAPEMINIFTGLDYQSRPHYTLVMDDSSESMTYDTTHYAIGGSDGTVSEAMLDTLVREECSPSWGQDEDNPLLDTARFPFSIVYDTGFSIETKKAIISLIGLRKDISVAVCTQDLLQATNTAEDEANVMTTLRSFAQMIPESTLHGTPVCRCLVLGQTGKRANSSYRRKLPVIIDLIEKRARYMGAGDGKYKSQYAYDVSPANRVESMSEITHPWKNDAARSRDWEIGLNWVQYADRSSLFYPTLQTVYSDDTSVLNNDINMMIAVDVIKMSEHVWAEMTGNTTLSTAEFRETCNAKLIAKVAGRYDGRVTIVPNTYFTAADEARGYSWTMDIAIYANNVRTVGTINVITRRSSDQITGA